jgi:hypothetical protein
VVLGLDYFRFMAGWYGAPTVDMTTMPATMTATWRARSRCSISSTRAAYHW